MTDTTDRTTHDQSSDSAPKQRPISVLYVADAQHHNPAAASALRDEHDMTVTVVHSFQAALGRARGGDADCIVCTASGNVDVDTRQTDGARDQTPPVPVVLSVEAESARVVRQAARCSWADGVVVRSADTRNATLLAHRIEQCVTHRRKHATAQRLRTALDRIDHGVVLATPDGRVEYANPAFDALGATTESVSEGSLVDLLSPLSDDGAVRQLQAAVTAGDAWSGEFTVDTEEDDTRSMRLAVNPVRDEMGDVQSVVALAEEVTERKQRERDRRWFKQAIDHAGHAIMLTDADGTIEYVNPAFEATTGYSAAEAVGERPSILKSGEHDDEFYRDLWETILSGDVWQGELTNHRKNGDRYQIEQTVAPIHGDDGDIEGFVAVNTDITDKKRYESQLERERDRLEEFAETVAHDLRNPLAIAFGHAQLGRGHTSNPDVADNLATSLSALERIETIVDEVLTLSRQGETIHDPEPVPVRQVAEAAWTHVETADATLSLEAGLADYAISADEGRLCELLENLFRNSVEHGSTGNQTAMRSSDAVSDVEVRIGRLDGDGFYVADDGPGLPTTDYSRIFESDFTTTEGGTGFGLAIVKQIVDAHGWTVTATDAETTEGGARFEIRTTAASSGDTRQA